MNDISVEENLGLVRSVVSKYISNSIKLEDTEEYSDGLIGLFNAIKKFDPTKNIKFSTLAYKCIKNSIIQGIRNRKRKKVIRPVHLEEDVVETIVKKNVDYSLIVDLILSSSKSEDESIKKIVLDHYIGGKTWVSLAKENNVSSMCLIQKSKIFLNSLKEKFSYIEDIFD